MSVTIKVEKESGPGSGSFFGHYPWKIRRFAAVIIPVCAKCTFHKNVKLYSAD